MHPFSYACHGRVRSPSYVLDYRAQHGTVVSRDGQKLGIGPKGWHVLLSESDGCPVIFDSNTGQSLAVDKSEGYWLFKSHSRTPDIYGDGTYRAWSELGKSRTVNKQRTSYCTVKRIQTNLGSQNQQTTTIRLCLDPQMRNFHRCLRNVTPSWLAYGLMVAQHKKIWRLRAC